jgi:hypothetical protein
MLCHPGNTLLSAPRAARKDWVGALQIPKFTSFFFFFLSFFFFCYFSSDHTWMLPVDSTPTPCTCIIARWDVEVRPEADRHQQSTVHVPTSSSPLPRHHASPLPHLLPRRPAHPPPHPSPHPSPVNHQPRRPAPGQVRFRLRFRYLVCVGSREPYAVIVGPPWIWKKKTTTTTTNKQTRKKKSW